MQVGFTGRRQGMPGTQINAFERLLKKLPVTEVHHGDCVGADAEFHEFAIRLSLDVVIHPPADARHRARSKGASRTCAPLEYLVRNKKIVLSTSVLVAAVQGAERQRSGTWATVRYARQLKRFIAIVDVTGELRFENDFPVDHSRCLDPLKNAGTLFACVKSPSLVMVAHSHHSFNRSKVS